jgi:hypothetical protein
MKILSKHKDYYDYLQGIYGIDEKMVYDRRSDNLAKPNSLTYRWEQGDDKTTYVEYTFAICNKIFTIYKYKGKIYHTVEELLELDDLLTKKDDTKGVLGYWVRKGGRKSLEKEAKEIYERKNTETDVNKKLRQPVLVKDSYGEFSAPITITHGGYFGSYTSKESAKWSIPILSEYGVASVYPAEKIYQDISSFLGWLVDNPPIPDNQTNDEKITSHGFDLKQSFRHRK